MAWVINQITQGNVLVVQLRNDGYLDWSEHMKNLLLVSAFLLLSPLHAKAEDIKGIETSEPVIFKATKLTALLAAQERFLSYHKSKDISERMVILNSTDETTSVVFTIWPDPIKNSDGTITYNGPRDSYEYVIDNKTGKIIKETAQ